MFKRKVTTGKYMGDDAYSWAVFVDGRPYYTGLSARERTYYRKKLIEKFNGKAVDKAAV